MNNVHKSDDTETTLAQENKLIATKAVEDMKQMIKDVSKTPIKHMKCEHCNSDFLSKSSMEAHIIDQHRNQQQTNTTSSKRDRMTSELTKSPSTIPPPKKVILEKVQHQGAGQGVTAPLVQVQPQGAGQGVNAPPVQVQPQGVNAPPVQVQPQEAGQGVAEQILLLAVEKTGNQPHDDIQEMDAETALSSEAQTAMVLSTDEKVEMLIAEVKTLNDKVLLLEKNLANKEEVTKLVTELTEENERLTVENKGLKGVGAENTPVLDDEEEEEFLTRDEELLVPNKKRGFKRTSPMTKSQDQEKSPNPLLLCGTCRSVFKSKNDLETHMKIHNEAQSHLQVCLHI